MRVRCEASVVVNLCHSEERSDQESAALKTNYRSLDCAERFASESPRSARDDNKMGLENRVQQKFPIALRAEDWGIDDIRAGAAFGQKRLANFVDGSGLGGFVADNAAFADMLPASLELRLYEHDELPALALYRKRRRDDRRQKQRGRNERDVHGDEIDELAHLFMGKVAGVGFLKQADPRILTKAKIDLSVPGIDCNDSRSPVLQQAIGKTAGGSADIQTNLALHVDLPVFQSFFQLKAAAAHVLQVFPKQTNLGVRVNGSAGFLDFLPVDQYVASEDERLGSFA
jgi:hypothetical protein